MRTVLTCVLALLAAGCPKPDTTAPTVASSVPADGATGVVRNTNIRTAFSEPMDHAATEVAFSLDPAVSGSFSWPADDEFVFTPSALLDSATGYACGFSTAAQDRAGNALAGAYQAAFTTGASVSSGLVYMLGRSVLEAWFFHWGWDGNDADPVTLSRFALYHRYVNTPDEGMVASVEDVVSQIPGGANPAVFFKLCFADFEGGSREDAEVNLARNKAIVDSVAGIVEGYGYPLIIGNALPNTAAETDEHLVWNHGQYNAWLETLAAASPDRVFVFDQYSVLTDPNTGALKPGYATGPHDAHPNEQGYAALDPVWLALLEENF